MAGEHHAISRHFAVGELDGLPLVLHSGFNRLSRFRKLADLGQELRLLFVDIAEIVLGIHGLRELAGETIEPGDGFREQRTGFLQPARGDEHFREVVLGDGQGLAVSSGSRLPSREFFADRE